MKTPDEIKRGLICCSHSELPCSECPYDGLCNTDSGQTPEDDAVALIDKLQSTYSQVSKALCGKEKATLDELLQAVSQLKSRLAQVERERDAAVSDILYVLHTKGTIDAECLICNMEKPDCKWECEKANWRGVCAENSKEDE